MTFSLGSTPRSLVKYNDQSISAITEIAASAKGDMVLIKELTASSDSTLEFVDGTDDVVLDNTYPIYVFKWINIHPSATANLTFNMSIDTGSNYNVTKTSTFWESYHNEADTESGISYEATIDLAQSTGYVNICASVGNGNDECVSGYMRLFNPSSTTFVKHFISETNEYYEDDYSIQCFVGGYGNTTSAVDAIQFKMASGEIQGGTISLYGIK